MSNHKKKSESCRVQKSVQKIQGYDHESREAPRRRPPPSPPLPLPPPLPPPPPREAEEKEGRRSTSFFLPCLRFLCTQEFGGHFFFAFAHFLLYTKDPDLLQALDLPVMPASAGEVAHTRPTLPKVFTNLKVDVIVIGMVYNDYVFVI